MVFFGFGPDFDWLDFVQCNSNNLPKLVSEKSLKNTRKSNKNGAEIIQNQASVKILMHILGLMHILTGWILLRVIVGQNEIRY